jgi:hypothetical protein
MADDSASNRASRGLELRLRLLRLKQVVDEGEEGRSTRGRSRGRRGRGSTMRGGIWSGIHGERKDLEGAPQQFHPRIFSIGS